MGRSSRLVDYPRLVSEAEGIYLKDSEFLVREVPNEWERRNAVFNLIAFSAKRYAAGERYIKNSLLFFFSQSEDAKWQRKLSDMLRKLPSRILFALPTFKIGKQSLILIHGIL